MLCVQLTDEAIKYTLEAKPKIFKLMSKKNYEYVEPEDILNYDYHNHIINRIPKVENIQDLHKSYTLIYDYILSTEALKRFKHERFEESLNNLKTFVEDLSKQEIKDLIKQNPNWTDDYKDLYKRYKKLIK